MTIIGTGPDYVAYMKKFMRDNPGQWTKCPECDNWRMGPAMKPPCPLCPPGWKPEEEAPVAVEDRLDQLGFKNPPVQRHSPTSVAAGDAVKGATGRLRLQVLRILVEKGPLTDEEMQELLDMNPSTQRPRRIELMEAGLVVDSGGKKATKSGRAAVLWQVNDSALDELEV